LTLTPHSLLVSWS